ncbi:hypothetical protein Pmar_PMAR016389 [Perkinsus marinus ATCC 50983]|uniref:Uncharacterized protein n=1 Tax=Perkinsus marinus (strain ATCC 50983 / TXsc) TaxID=423536 RepID=C5L8I5_PERM5|nr:hypothetical protein Pmar_PMAR016389 [Perkinsus marinus ATCC 50983]EER06974.1 hypothetical protein Pmar_PMAR016389 [Perkinsus marinus ATCC 50983]|eukprot:XP_002775158.1 hypothetical protein Pmar_PMAR016389 [Perkinsus marinus ATCC 50983]
MWEVSELKPVSTFQIDMHLKKPKLTLRDFELLYVRGKTDTTAQSPRRLYLYLLYRMIDKRALQFCRRKLGERRKAVTSPSSRSAIRIHRKPSGMNGDDLFTFLYPIMSTEDLITWMTRLFPRHLEDFQEYFTKDGAVIDEDIMTTSHFVQLFKSVLWNRCNLTFIDRRAERPEIPIPPRSLTAQERYYSRCREIRQQTYERSLLDRLKVEPAPKPYVQKFPLRKSVMEIEGAARSVELLTT